MDDLTKAIDKLLNEKTFTVEAVRGIEELRKRAADLHSQLARTQELQREYSDKYAIAAGENAILKARENAVAEREKKMTELEMKAAVESAKAQVWDQCFGRIFANRIVREHVNDSVPVLQTYSGGGSSIVRDYSSKDITREES